MMMFFIFMAGIYMYINFHKHILMMLLTLELLMLLTYLMMMINFSLMDLNLSLSLYYLSVSVCDGALGLSLLVKLIRTWSNDSMNLFTMYN
uniref:NADH dehydrogenase subunit 4L n=1 Tax=Decolopoda australis TaxID=373278 RepID=UPI002264F90E|nr:NADH dehydrogenase subunit 4L [Decolopoda australis]UYX57783.1 NADH dehydrogenase subunit 4L [Decolopoda australis]